VGESAIAGDWQCNFRAALLDCGAGTDKGSRPDCEQYQAGSNQNIHGISVLCFKIRLPPIFQFT
jgi:hypothetical protein